MELKELIDYTEKNKTIVWNNENLIKGIGDEYEKYLSNHTFPQGKVHGYFTLIHNLIKELPDDAVIVELGNREGMSTLAIYDALKPNQKFYTIDIIKDLRVLPKEFFNDSRVNIINGDCTSNDVVSLFDDESIDFLFSDTIHYYEQVDKEFKSYKRKLKNDAIIYVDDIRLNNKGQFFTEWKGEKYDLGAWAHESGFGCFKYTK